MSGNSNPGDRTIYTNSYTTATCIIIVEVLQITRAVHNCITSRKDGIIMMVIMTIAIAYIDASFQKNKWVKEGGIKE
jgi:hypothetical protein